MPGKKTNTDKNHQAAREFVERKQEGRPKQVWVWDLEPSTMGGEEVPGIGHWEKVEDGRSSLPTPQAS
jgi:hypothetical protein